MKNAQATILIIDDDQSFTDMIEQMLTTLNYSFMSSTDPNAAPNLFTGFPGQFDPVMVDEIMPTVKGTHLITRMLKIKDDVPAVLMTRHGDMAPRERLEPPGRETYS